MKISFTSKLSDNRELEYVYSIICNGKCDGCPCNNVDTYHRSHGCFLDNMPQAMSELAIDEWQKRVVKTVNKRKD